MTAQLSRERLEEIAALPLKTTSWGLEHAPGAYSTVYSHEIVEMARMLLAVLDSEPLAYFYPGDETEWQGVALAEELDDEQKARCIPLYTAPPAPVAVPDELTFEKIAEITASQGYEYSINECICAASWWNACRAAMLKAGPVTEAKVPDGLASSVKCWCRSCRPVSFSDMRFVVCPDCGNKRCPRANDHRNACSGSNEPGQVGSAYPAAPEQEVKP